MSATMHVRWRHGRRWAAVTVLGGLVTLAACSSNDCQNSFGGIGCTYSAEIVNGDTTLFKGESAAFRATATYGVGVGDPTAVQWGTTDTAKLAVFPRTDLTASVTAKDSGAAYLVAFINRQIYDSVLVTIVPEGGARWRSTFTDPISLQPAVFDDSLIRIVTGGGSPTLRVFDPTGADVGSAAACFSSLGPSVGLNGEAYVTGDGCTQRFGVPAVSDWSASSGSATLGVAVAADGGAVVATSDSVYRFSTTGTVVWAQPLGGPAITAPVIATTGAVYVGWRSGGADSVSHFGSDGTPGWSLGVPGLSAGTPAVVGAQLLFGRPGGLFSVDTAGTVTWDRAFSTDNPAATATGATSSPVVDGSGIVFVQNEDALYSYSVGGIFLWAADSLGYGPATGPVGAPALLITGSLVVPCQVPGGREVCVVHQIDAELAFRTDLGGGSALGVALSPEDGTIYVNRALASGGSELVAVWARAYVEPAGWPVEGGDQARTRRQ